MRRKVNIIFRTISFSCSFHPQYATSANTFLSCLIVFFIFSVFLRQNYAMIVFYKQNTNYLLKNKRLISKWLNNLIDNEKFKTGSISVILCSDADLLSINQQFLSHHFYTDIITFQYNDPTSLLLDGELYISIDTIKANALEYNVTFLDELYRVMAHGCLHLCGYKDDTPEAQVIMRDKENYYLATKAMFSL